MPLRVTASRDPTAPESPPSSPSSSSARPSVAPSSTSAADCSAASQVRRPAPAVSPEPAASPSGKMARLYGPDPVRPLEDDDIDMRSPDDCKAEVDVSRPLLRLLHITHLRLPLRFRR